MPRETLASWNGVIMPLAAVKVSPLDRAFLFGDAVYEVIALAEGRPWQPDLHLERLAASLRGLAIHHDLRALGRHLAALLSEAHVSDGMVYIQVTRGEGPREHVPKQALRPNELIYAEALGRDSLDALRLEGARAVIAPDQRWGLCHLKTVNLLGNVLAQLGASQEGCFEALQYDRDGFMTEGTRTNLFCVRGKQLVTPPLSQNILPGITRHSILALARQHGISAAEERIPMVNLASHDEVFVCGTLSEIIPIVSVNGQALGLGRPGPITLSLQQLLRNAKTGLGDGGIHRE